LPFLHDLEHVPPFSIIVTHNYFDTRHFYPKQLVPRSKEPPRLPLHNIRSPVFDTTLIPYTHTHQSPVDRLSISSLPLFPSCYSFESSTFCFPVFPNHQKTQCRQLQPSIGRL